MKWMSAGLIALALALVPAAFGQGVTTAGVTGFVLDPSGKPIVGAKVLVLRVDSGTRSTATTTSSGAYTIDGLQAGGPYTISADTANYGVLTTNDIYLEIGNKYHTDFNATSDVVKLEAMTVGGKAGDEIFNSGKMSYGSTMNSREIQNVVSVRRDIQDLANLDPRAALQQVSTTDSQYALSFVGQNPRQNLILIDGVSATDNFGLNSNGVAGFASPIAPEWIQSTSTEISPVDMVYSNFTGGLQNFTLKSGTNSFHGGVYEQYEGTNFRGPDPTPSTVFGKHEPYQRHHSGLYVGGPIIRDKLFLFAGYDALRIITVPPVQNFTPDLSDGTYAAIIAKTATYGYPAGSFNAVNHLWNQNFVGKINWNISDNQKFELTFRHTAGEAPNFFNYTSSFETSLSSSWYNTYRTDQSITAKFNSDWSSFIPTLQTEIEATYKRYNGTARLNGGVFPAITIDGVPGTPRLAGAFAPFTLFLGTNPSFQNNNIYTWEQEEHAYGEWTHGNHNFKFGAQFDRIGYTDTFIPNYVGSYTFASVADYLNATPTGFTQEVPANGYTLGEDVSHYYMLQISPLIQDTWTPTENLTVVAGLRLDDPYEPQKPITSAVFTNAYGYSNSTTMSGNSTVSPRIGFNYKLPTALRTQIHGSAGLYLGQNPVVWYENAFNNAGQLNTATIGSTSSSPTTAVIPGYTFNGLKSPAVTGFTTPGQAVPSFDINDPNFHWPANWRENLSIDRELGVLGLILSGNIDLSQVQKDSITRNLNYKLPTSGPALLPDGRIRYNGAITPSNLGTAFPNPATGAAYAAVTSLSTVATMSANPATGAVYELTNTSKGGSQSYSLSLGRPMKDGWQYSIGYAHTHATVVDPSPSSVASSNFADNPMVNPNDNIAYRSQYAIPDKFVAQLAHQFHFLKAKHSTTTLSGQFIAQTGQPFSYVFKGDADGSGLTGESLFYVPTGPGDSKVAWASPAEEAAFFQYLATDPALAKYSGAITPRNAFYAPWQHTVNLHFEQELPGYKDVHITLFWDCFNFANLINKKYGIVENWNSSFNTRTVAGTTYNAATNQYVYTFNAATLNSAISIYPDMSRWTMTVGARLEF